MKKIYFANTPWSESKTLVENFRHQTPYNSGIWDNITFTLNKDEADYIIVMDETSETVVEEKVIFLGREPAPWEPKNGQETLLAIITTKKVIVGWLKLGGLNFHITNFR